jgi:hypothetical protein
MGNVSWCLRGSKDCPERDEAGEKKLRAALSPELRQLLLPEALNYRP